MRSVLIALVCLLAGCARLQPYTLDLQQGNALAPDVVARLKPGMSRQQVNYALGTPILKDSFHADRWDYPYYVRRKGEIVDRKHLVAIFQDDRLVALEGDLAPPDFKTRASQASETAPAAAKTATPAAAAGGTTDTTTNATGAGAAARTNAAATGNSEPAATSADGKDDTAPRLKLDKNAPTVASPAKSETKQ